MSQDDDRALEAVAAALVSNKCHCEQCAHIRREQARKAITAYLSAIPQRLSPELIAQLNKLATYLTAQGEYEACDLIDTVVARVSAMPQRELLAEALDALTPFAAQSRASGPTEERNIRRARAAAALIRAQAERVRVLESALSAIVRISQETDELTELSAKEVIEALVNCEQTARAALKAAP